MDLTQLSNALLIELAKAARRIGEDYPDIYDEVLAEFVAAHARWLVRVEMLKALFRLWRRRGRGSLARKNPACGWLGCIFRRCVDVSG